jgi:antitoxin (DNA-binding transcriptional repressor) of toxin-antitoxin stability system
VEKKRDDEATAKTDVAADDPMRAVRAAGPIRRGQRGGTRRVRVNPRTGRWERREKYPLSQARTHLPDLVRAAEAAGEITEITRHGHGVVAAVVPPEVLDAAEAWEDYQAGLRAEENRRTDRESGESNVPWRELRDEPTA